MDLLAQREEEEEEEEVIGSAPAEAQLRETKIQRMRLQEE